MSLPHLSASDPSPIAGSVLPIQRAEELLLTLPGVISARIMADVSGAVEEIHILTMDTVSPKQTVRNVESALIAHLGMRVSHKKISVAMTTEDGRPRHSAPQGVPVVPGAAERPSPPAGTPVHPTPVAAMAPVASTTPASSLTPVAALHAVAPGAGASGEATAPPAAARRQLYFEDIEVRRSRTRGVTVRVTLRKGDEAVVGEAEGLESERIRVELAARATLAAIAASGESRAFALEGYKLLEAFDREFVFVGVTVRLARETMLLTGSAEVKESAETSAVLAVLDATNRWVAFGR